jgi:hypothetical protein
MTMLYLMPVPTSTSYVLHRLTFSYGCHHGSCIGARDAISCVRAQRGRHGRAAAYPRHPLNDPASGPCRSSACECWLKRAAVCLGRRAGVAESTPQSTQRCRATLLPQAWFAYSARCLARAVDAAVYRRTRPVRRTQALCLARSPPYDVCSRSDDLAGARIPPRPQQPSASTARARGSRTSWQVPRPTTENAKNRSYSTF